MRFIYSILFAVSFFISTGADAQCLGSFKDIPIASKLATSSTYANLRGSADSLKVLTEELMQSAINEINQATHPEPFCPAGCKIKPEREIVFLSTPNKYLSGYDDEQVCQGLKSKTQTTPIEFKNKVFGNLDELNSYYSDLSRGGNTDGKQLYKICHSSCSPSYKSVILQVGSEYRMNTEIICGDARDKSEGMYQLSSFYRWGCQTE